MLDRFKCQQLSSVHALSAHAKLLKRAQLFLRESSFARHPVQQGMSTMSPVMVQALAAVSAASNQVLPGLLHARYSRSCASARHQLGKFIY